MPNAPGLIWGGRRMMSVAFGAIGLLLGVGGRLIPGALGPVHRAWMALAHAISKVTTPIFMGAVYFVVLAPVSVVMRLFGRNPLVHAQSCTHSRARTVVHAQSGTAWITRTVRRGDLLRQF